MDCLNKSVNIQDETFEELVEELSKREELACTGEVCGAQAVGW